MSCGYSSKRFVTFSIRIAPSSVGIVARTVRIRRWLVQGYSPIISTRWVAVSVIVACAGVAIAYTGVARVDGTANAEAVSADLLAQSMDALGAAVTDGSFLTTLQAADAAFAAVTVDETATQAAIAAAVVVFVVTTPAPSTAPAPRPTPAPSVAVASGVPSGDDGTSATDGGTAAAAEGGRAHRPHG